MALATPNPSVELLTEYFRARHYTFEKFTLDGSDFTRFISPTGLSWLTQDAHVSYPFLHATAHKISARKDIAYELCEKHGVSAPWTKKVHAQTPKAALAACLNRGKLVVKPRSASLSRGVTLNVETLDELQQAISIALKFCDEALVQQQISGEEVRFVVLDGKVRAAMLRQTARLIGDGTATTGELLAIENAERRKLKMRYLSYPELTPVIIDFDDIDLDSVPAAGQTVELGRGTMIRTGASVYNVIDETHTSYKQIAEKLANILGARFVVVDLMIEDYRIAARKDNYAFIEFNTAPVLKLFYSCRDGHHYDVLEQLGAMIDASLQRTIV